MSNASSELWSKNEEEVEFPPGEGMSESSTAAGNAPYGENSMMEGVEKYGGKGDERDEEEEEEEEQEHEQEEQEQEFEEEESYYESGSSRSEIETWISSFCSMRGHEYFAEVTEDFIEDDFNLTGLSSLVPFYKEALDMILDYDPDPDESSRLPNMPVIENSAEQLYGLIHARFLLTRSGLTIMAEKYDLQHFGTCPRYLCHQTPVLPIGTSDLPGNDTVKLYCPSCADIYSPIGKEQNEVDGAYFGTSFAGLFLKTYTDIPGPFGVASVKILAASAPEKPNDDTTNASKTSGATTTTGAGGQPKSGGETENTNGDGNDTTTTTSTAVTTTTESDIDKWDIYDMHLFGFKVSERSKSGPRMRWLRERPRDVSELGI
ncbi:casein kinase II regulatory subunit-domain-containing protein [Lipomyces tetrasporus]|uniref:Casein kinase II subunit beta n=1 Tax=Lipomyces tetrasporus TaxID=54092 RepID=A0AAD7QMN4_9ASCO|nr:casein kinase II regulatory subunit-domain-containing protein [Lipomyces tetrasporus]KAJ8097979.1 casein kinase II regulatory subunit-domain-containing protein [Lipomyces tetrasporus]